MKALQCQSYSQQLQLVQVAGLTAYRSIELALLIAVLLRLVAVCFVIEPITYIGQMMSIQKSIIRKSAVNHFVFVPAYVGIG